jgi:hypothetical protein
MSDPLHDLLNAFSSSPRLLEGGSALIESKKDDRASGRTFYRITSLTKSVVQGAIAACLEQAERAPHGAYSTFLGPHRFREGWLAVGEIVERQMVPA